MSDRHGPRCLTLLAMILVTAGCSQPFPDGLDPMVLSAIAAGTPTTPTTPTTPDARKFIFVTVGTHNGNLGGVSGADGICAAEKTANFASLPGAATEYDALLTDGAARVACTTPNCGGGVGEHTDWVLATSTDYYRSDGQLLFQTNGKGIFFFGTLTNPFSTNGSDEWWTGLFDDWTLALTPGPSHCGGWILADASLGFYGVGGDVTGFSLASLDGICSVSANRHLLCVRR